MASVVAVPMSERGHRDQQHDHRHQPGGEGERPPRSERHDAGFRTYPAPRIVWIIGSRPASTFLRR